MFNLQGGVIQAGNHDTLQFFVVSQRTSPALQSWHKREQLASGLVVAILARRPTGHRIWTFTWPQFLREFQKTTARLGITVVPYQIRHSVLSIDRARDLRSQEAAQRRGRWTPLKSMVRCEKSARLSKTLSASKVMLHGQKQYSWT